jgi:hypothetical protein
LYKDEPDQTGDEQSLTKAACSPCSRQFQHLCVRWNEMRVPQAISRSDELAGVMVALQVDYLGCFKHLR